MKRILTTLSQKWPEYLLEILVLIIGIYGAFAVESWNENQKSLRLEKEILLQIKSDIQVNLVDVYADLQDLLLGRKSAIIIEKALKSDLPYNDTLCFHFENMYWDEFTIGEVGGYESLKQIGVGLISNDTIRNSLVFLFDGVLPRLSPSSALHEDLSAFLSPFYTKNFYPNTDTTLRYSYTHILPEEIPESWKLRHGKTRTFYYPKKVEVDEQEILRTFGFVPIDFEALKRDPEFKMLMNRAEAIRNHKILWYERAQMQMIRLIHSIEKEIQ